MSPGARQHETVYVQLKQVLLSGSCFADRELSVTQLAADLGTSVSPVRDALHRLYGEGLLAMGEHRGFRLIGWSEEALRDCYTWHGHLIRMAVKARKSRRPDDSPVLQISAIDCSSPDRLVESAEAMFLGIAESSWSNELAAAVRNAGERLRAVRLAETERWSDCGDELLAANTLARSGTGRALLEVLWNYHRRRIRAARG
ncbi:GntR family transcriptional regulator, partial [Sphingobium sp.]|uniref:GntR family transcriptional regulator n=1 Tax=Sphingobium sp. TaxID=1912891 RepID=UPI002B7EDE1B